MMLNLNKINEKEFFFKKKTKLLLIFHYFNLLSNFHINEIREIIYNFKIYNINFIISGRSRWANWNNPKFSLDDSQYSYKT